MEQAIQYAPRIGTPFVWDQYIPSGKCVKDDDGLWHVGVGTDLQVAIFDFGLTKKDHEFLKAIRAEKP